MLFYNFSLDAHVPADHLLRSIDRFVELSELRRELAPFYSSMGRPSVAPELMIRMLIIGYCFGIRSERRLCEEVHLNLAYRWFCRLGLDGDVPDHSTFSKNRHGRFRASDLLRRVFETVLQRCIREGLVGGEAFAIDASLIKADANRQRGIEGEKGLPPEATGRAVIEYMAVLDDAAFGAATDVVPKFVSPADPAARWTGAHGGQAFFAYSTNYLIDVDNAIIVDVVAMALPGQDPVHKVSIIPRGIGALGYTIQRPTEDRFPMTEEELENRMAVILGGLPSTSSSSTGAADDLVKATDTARSTVLRYGMDEKLGHVAMSASANPCSALRCRRAGMRVSSAMKRSGSWTMRSAIWLGMLSTERSKSSTCTARCTRRRLSCCYRRRRSRRRTLRRYVPRLVPRKRPRRRLTSSRSRPPIGRRTALTQRDLIRATAREISMRNLSGC